MVDTSKALGRLGSKQHIEEMSWPEIRAAIDNGQRTVVAAAGSMEQHGPHLPIQTDTLLGTFLATAIVERLSGVLRGPTIPFGVSEHHMPFAGTITLDSRLFQEVVRQYVASLAAHGFTDIFIIPSHGGNFGPLRQLEHDTGGAIAGARFVAFSDLTGFLEVMNGIAERHGITPAVSGAHAGEAETSLVLAARDDLVSMENAEVGFVDEFDENAQRAVFEQGMVALTSNGILGDARPARADRGFAYRDGMADFLAAWIRERIP
ncbi:MAG TPA: creatininase family protein [Thermomicrobiales bacterium]|nr:creatininase family protein [Thermomicrobiales bacterium]